MCPARCLFYEQVMLTFIFFILDATLIIDSQDRRTAQISPLTREARLCLLQEGSRWMAPYGSVSAFLNAQMQ